MPGNPTFELTAIPPGTSGSSPCGALPATFLDLRAKLDAQLKFASSRLIWPHLETWAAELPPGTEKPPAQKAPP